jgi:tRNA (guanine-N7-)-methyltransferase
VTTIDDIICPPPAPETLFDPAAAFGRAAPFELEIGCGKGAFLLRRAREHPEINLLGIEWANKIFRYAADRMARWGMTNVRVMRTDAAQFVRCHLAESCLAALHIYHPDPWPKKRHHKRRLIQPAFVASAVRAMAPGARLAVQTDHAEYFAWMREVFAGFPELEEIAFDDPSFGTIEETIQTNYEIKYLREGRPIHRAAFRRRAGAGPAEVENKGV